MSSVNPEKLTVGMMVRLGPSEDSDIFQVEQEMVVHGIFEVSPGVVGVSVNLGDGKPSIVYLPTP